MKMIILLILILTSSIFISCKKDKNNIETHVRIKGKLTGITKNSKSFSLSEVKKVLVFSGLKLVGGSNSGLSLSFVDIVDGSFTAISKMGKATGFVFLDVNNKYIGTLSTQGLNLLPLGDLKNGDSTTIDLSTLTLVGNSFIPLHDPFGKEIIITQAEINSLKEIDGYFESLSKNIDADNDGVLDVLNDRQIFVKSVFSIKAGTYGTNTTEPVIDNNAITSIQYAANITGAAGFATPDIVKFYGPEGNPDAINVQIGCQGTGFEGHSWNLGVARPGDLPLEPGIYDITFDGTLYTVSFSNIDAKYNLVFVTPTINTNSEGKLVSFSLKYQHSDYTDINPDNIITNVMLQFCDSVGHQIYNSPWLFSGNYEHVNDGNSSSGFYSYTLPSPVDISTLKYIDAGYNDLLGNGYTNRWMK